MIKMLFLVMTVFVSNLACARVSYSEWSDQLIKSILENETSCVDRYEEDKIYLNPDKINATEQGICLNINDRQMVQLAHLAADKRGCFVLWPYQRTLKNCYACSKKYYAECINPRCTLSQNHQQPVAPRQRNKDEKY